MVKSSILLKRQADLSSDRVTFPDKISFFVLARVFRPTLMVVRYQQHKQHN